ncbi:MAG TPA: hypothetical protein DCE41_30000 [Cytophagales bacterium]|nr:hypothetical protein [Cytophagales bacterium]HAA24256.1 hypothetical protein [Cytophagales bacterium]HAP60238.1 hypothetical protein [Cytophagales bacterium]
MDNNPAGKKATKSNLNGGLKTNQEIRALGTVVSFQYIGAKTSEELVQNKIANIKGIQSFYHRPSKEYYTDTRNIHNYAFYELNLVEKLDIRTILYTVSAVYALLAKSYSRYTTLTGVILNVRPYGLTFLIQFGQGIGYDGYLTYFLNRKTKTLHYLYELGPEFKSTYYKDKQVFSEQQQVFKNKVLAVLNSFSPGDFFTNKTFTSVSDFARKHDENPNFELYDKEIGNLNPDTISIIVCEGARFSIIREAYLQGKLSAQTIFWGDIIQADGESVIVAIGLVQLWRSWGVFGKFYSISPDQLLKQLLHFGYTSQVEGNYFLKTLDLRKGTQEIEQIKQSPMLSTQAKNAGQPIPKKYQYSNTTRAAQ